MSGFVFGKMPAHGDFIARGLAAEERDALDNWLAGEMAAARDALGEAFEERYDSAPPWRFACGETAGAMASSVDSVGRRFPLLVGRTEAAADTAAGIAEACEQAIYDAFENAWTADDLAAAVSGLKPGTAEPAAEGWWTLGGEDFEPASVPGDRPDGLMIAILGDPRRQAA